MMANSHYCPVESFCSAPASFCVISFVMLLDYLRHFFCEIGNFYEPMSSYPQNMQVVHVGLGCPCMKIAVYMQKTPYPYVAFIK